MQPIDDDTTLTEVPEKLSVTSDGVCEICGTVNGHVSTCWAGYYAGIKAERERIDAERQARRSGHV